MDDTQPSRVSDAAATRKRRSSILKSQRPARTPFSELEFNVATPTDTAKSRRVSFSRRTGVAEFITNEATTTWKNFYEEHNKSLESSSNDSEANASRQPVGHLGKRIFDQQFEEVEAVDFIGSLNANGSLNNINFEQQLASLECTADRQLTAPQNKFELSALTDQQSKLFGNDLTAPCVGEMSGRIDINFSAMHQVGGNDDLDEIQRDIEQASSNMGSHDPFSQQNMSEYIEVDLNMTHVARNENDMSITDTICSPIKDVSKSCSKDKKVSLNENWETDKENIAINPYAAPRESINFAISDEPDQVLVFDGKRLTLQPDKPEKEKNYRQTLLPNSSVETPQRKSIVLNCNDDLPNFVDDMLNSQCDNSGLGIQDLKSSTLYTEGNLSMTLPLNRIEIIPKRQTILDNTGNISMTQALPTNILSETAVIVKENTEKRRTIVFEEDAGNISVTQSLPVNIIANKLAERRRTVVYEDDTGNISITQAVPTNIIINEISEDNEKHKTIVFDDDNGNVSVTQAISTNNILENKEDKRKTIVFDDDEGDVSMAQALPANIVLLDKQLQEKRRTIIYENDTGNISVTQAVPANVILAQQNELAERRRTVVYEDDTGNISVTQALPSNILLDRIELGSEKTKINEPDTYPTTQSLPTNSLLKDSEVNKRRTIVYEDDTGNISITQAISNQIIPGHSENITETISKAIDVAKELCNEKSQNRMVIVYDNDEDDDISMTQAISNNIILPNETSNKRDTILFDSDHANISMTGAIAANVFLLDKLNSDVEQSIKIPVNIEETNVNVIDYVCEPEAPISAVDEVQEKRKTILLTADECDAEMSMTEVITKVDKVLQKTEKRQTIIFDNENCNISMTKPIPAELLNFQNEILDKSKNKELYLADQDQVANPQPDVIVYQATTTNSVPQLQPNTEEGESNSKHSINSSEPNITSSSEVKVTSSSDVKGASSSEVIDDFDGSVCTEEGASADVSLLHPRVEEKSDQLLIKKSIVMMDVDVKVNDVTDIQKETSETEDSLFLEKSQDSLLNTLLDMSNSTLASGTEDKNIMAQIESIPSSAEDAKEDIAAPSNDSMFYITRDSDEEAQTREMDKVNQASVKSVDMPTIAERLPLALKTSEEEDPEEVDVLQEKLALLKTVTSEAKRHSINRFFEKIVCSDLEGVVEREENTKLREQSMNFKKANNTQELLEMISDFTDMEDDNKKEVIVSRAKGHMALEHMVDTTEPERLALPITLSREDLLNNISMAQAALQQSRFTLDDCESIDESTRDASTDQMSRKSTRMSYEVVKTLHFDDESMSEVSFKSGPKMSPLTKTAFGETSYMTESKGKVIPTYLKDVSDGIKELMLDLVKPMTDNVPFESVGVGKGVKTVPSTQSTQIQANLITSSQVDMYTELYSNPDIGYDIDKMSSLSSGANKPKSSTFGSHKFPTKFSEKSSDLDVTTPKQMCSYSREPVKPSTPATPATPATPGRVLVFDHLNPLNNILLGFMDYSDAHKYNPKKSEETLCDSNRSRTTLIHFDANTKDNEYDVDNVTTNYRLETQHPSAMQGDTVACPYKQDVSPYKQDVRPYKQDDERSLLSNTSKAFSIDESIDAKVMELKDNEVNTLIAMKGNKELLEASSSLTLVDDDLVQQSDVDSEIRLNTDIQDEEPRVHHKVRISTPTVEMEYHIEDQGTTTDNIMKTDYNSQDEEQWDQNKKLIKSKKRMYSPANTGKPQFSLDVTPKPNMKMQKMSYSPNVYRQPSDLPVTEESNKMAAEKDVSESIEHIDHKGHTSKGHDKKKSPHKTKDKKPGMRFTVQQLITEYRIDGGIDPNVLDKQIFEALNPKSESSLEPASQSDVLKSNSLEMVSSFTSSKNLNTVQDVHSVTTTLSQQAQPSRNQSKSTKMDWHPELISAMSSKALDSDFGINVVAKIDMLPFMGSHECEWEASSADTWSFRLLHGRLRLTARLVHRHENSIRTRVMGDTPVLDIAVETVQYEKKNPVATLCIRFACETMRYIITRVRSGECYASDIPPLLRRCAAVARVALRWGRAMHDAKLHLAYTLDNNGYLSLKVANVPLRSVWEVSMRVELVLEDARSALWPRASAVHVARVVSDVTVPDSDVRRVLAGTPRDWGHAPRTIWRMFRYLKHKTRDDDLLLGS